MLVTQIPMREGYHHQAAIAYELHFTTLSQEAIAKSIKALTEKRIPSRVERNRGYFVAQGKIKPLSWFPYSAAGRSGQLAA